MTNLISVLWGHLRLSDEERRQTREARAQARAQASEASKLTETVKAIEERNNFGWKFHNALRERPH